jgi:hypothetical protein
MSAPAVTSHSRDRAEMTHRPVRVQRRRTRGWRLPPGTRYVGRPTRWGNPWSVSEHGHAGAVARYRADLQADPARLAAARVELGGRDLACWCPLDLDCHADTLLELANPTGGAGGADPGGWSGDPRAGAVHR